MKIVCKKIIAAPPDVVFRRAADFANAPQAIKGIAKVEMLTSGPVGIGTKFRETRIFFGREATEQMEVTAFEPPHRYALGAESHGCRYHSELTFRPSGQGCEVEMTFEGTPLTFFAKVMSVLMRPMIKSVAKVCAKDLDDLKETIESEQRNAAP